MAADTTRGFRPQIRQSKTPIPTLTQLVQSTLISVTAWDFQAGSMTIFRRNDESLTASAKPRTGELVF